MSEAHTNTAGRYALICGVGGLLLEKGYMVTGTSRDGAGMSRHGWATLGIEKRVDVVSMAPNSCRSVLQTITRRRPDEIYNLARRTSVGLCLDIIQMLLGLGNRVQSWPARSRSIAE